MFIPVSLWDVKSFLPPFRSFISIPTEEILILNQTTGEFLNSPGDLWVKNQKPEFSKHVLSSDWVSGVSHTTVEKAEKTLLLPCVPLTAFHRCHSCQDWYTCSHGDFCCKKTGILLQKALQLHLLTCYFGKRRKEMLKCIINCILL